MANWFCLMQELLLSRNRDGIRRLVCGGAVELNWPGHAVIVTKLPVFASLYRKDTAKKWVTCFCSTCLLPSQDQAERAFFIKVTHTKMRSNNELPVGFLKPLKEVDRKASQRSTSHGNSFPSVGSINNYKLPRSPAAWRITSQNTLKRGPSRSTRDRVMAGKATPLASVFMHIISVKGTPSQQTPTHLHSLTFTRTPNYLQTEPKIFANRAKVSGGSSRPTHSTQTARITSSERMGEPWDAMQRRAANLLESRA